MCCDVMPSAANGTPLATPVKGFELQTQQQPFAGETAMTALTTTILAASTGTAAGVSLVYLLMGGGLLGAVVIFAVAKML